MKSRETPGPVLKGSHIRYVASTGKPGVPELSENHSPRGSKEELISHNSRGYPRYKETLPFRSSKVIYHYDVKNVDWSPGIGRIVNTDLALILPTNDVNYLTSPDLTAWGTTGYKRFKPKLQSVDTSLFLYELREFPGMIADIPKLIQKRFKAFLQIPSVFLAYSFGWAPLISDLVKMYKTTQNVDKIIQQALRDNNKNITRGGTLLATSSTNSIAPQNSYYKAYSGFTFTGTPATYATNITSQDIWFEGKFKYSIPYDMTLKWTEKTKSLLLGRSLDISPSTIYNAIPWSWLFDWFTNLGDVIDNLDNGGLDNLVALYACTMCTTVETLSYTLNGKMSGLKMQQNGFGHFVPAPDTASLQSCSLTSYRKRITKERALAHPYGFGITYSLLSDYQKAILLALGFNKYLRPSS